MTLCNEGRGKRNKKYYKSMKIRGTNGMGK
jgi:hypothetical protein